MKMTYRAKKIIKSIVVIVILLVVALGIFLVVKNKDALWGKVESGTTLYTQEQLDQEKDKAYNEGFNNAHLNNAELKKQVEEYLKTITEKNNTIAEKEEKINQDSQTIEANKTTIAGLNADLTAKQEVINEKQAKIEQNNTTITNLQTQLAELEQSSGEEKTALQNQITNLQNDNTALQNNITELTVAKAGLQTQINSLQLQNTQLQQDNANNLATIAELNANITTLQTQVTNLTNQIAQNESLVAEYEANKEAWQSSIAYYEQFIASLETDTQAVAIFESNSSIHKVQIVTKGTCATVTNPANTDNMAFVGWCINNELVDINNYPITTTTKFIAKFDIAYNVKFMLDNETEFATKKVAKGSSSTELETLPTKPGYEFMGFTINGVDIVDYKTYTINKDTTFIARFSKLHIVTFMSGCETIATQEVKNGDYAQALENYANEWLLNGELINITNYPIYADITFCEYGIITSAQEIDVGMNNENLDAQYIWNYKGNTYYSYYGKQYKFNKDLKKFETKNWGDKTPMAGNNVWQMEESLYYSNGTTQLEYDEITDTWKDKVWNSTFDYFASYGFKGSDIFTNNNIDYYYIDKTLGSYQYCELYKLNKDNFTWVGQNLNNTQKYEFYYIDAVRLWTDNNELYYSNGGTQKIINLETLTLVDKVWQGFSPASGNCVINYGNKVYSLDANGYYLLNNNTGIFEETVIDSPVELSGDRMWSDGINLYYTLSKTYILS